MNSFTSVATESAFTTFTVLEKSQAKEERGRKKVSWRALDGFHGCPNVMRRCSCACGWACPPVCVCEHRTSSPPTSVISFPPPLLKAKQAGSPKLKKMCAAAHTGALGKDMRPPFSKRPVTNVFQSIVWQRRLTGLGPVLGHARSDRATFKVQCGRLAGLRGL